MTRPGLRAANLSNLALASALILIWGAFAAIMDLLAGRPIPLGAVPVLMTFGLVLAALMEFSVTHAALTPRVYLLGGFAAGLYCILPVVVAAVMDSMAPMRFSPFGYVTQLGDRGGGSWDPAWLNIALLLLLGFLIRRRYRSI